MKNVLTKIEEAKNLIRSKRLSKNATNAYSKYDYFTPEIVEKSVKDVCNELNIACACSLVRNEFGLQQELSVYDLDSDEFIKFVLATEVAELKAANSCQFLGATDTYSERYIKMKVFGIKDNSLDPDSGDNSKPLFSVKNPKHIQSLNAARDKGINGKDLIDKIRSTMNLTDQTEELINNGSV